jgi:short-subunit dehydrogenase
VLARRPRQQKGGQIINISSLAGLTTIPFMGIYAASKFAVEGHTEALRLEVSREPLPPFVNSKRKGPARIWSRERF